MNSYTDSQVEVALYVYRDLLLYIKIRCNFFLDFRWVSFKNYLLYCTIYAAVSSIYMSYNFSSVYLN